MPFPFRRNRPPVTRILRSDKADSCAAIHAQSFAHSWSSAEFETLLSAKNTIATAATDPVTEELRGFALARLAADEAEILTIAVQQTYRNLGVGRALLADCVSRLAALHVQSLFLEVERGNLAALALYARMGFQEVGQRRGYYQKQGGATATALVLRKSLA